MLKINGIGAQTALLLISFVCSQATSLTSLCLADEPKSEKAPDQLVKPKLDQATLECGVQKLKPTRTRVPSEWLYRAGERYIRIQKQKMSAFTEDSDKPLWTLSLGDSSNLLWLGADDRIAYLAAYTLDENGEFSRYITPTEVARLDLTNGQWLKPLPPVVSKDKAVRPAGTVSVLASDGHVAILNAFVKRDKDGVNRIAEYEVSCYLAGWGKPSWSKPITCKVEMLRRDDDTSSPVRPPHSDPNLQHLSWLDNTLIVCADAMQPILNLNRDTGTLLWEIDRPWELQRQYSGLGLGAQYQITRFGNDPLAQETKATAAARESFDKQFECAIVGGPIVVPLIAERVNDSHSIFVAVSRYNRTDMGHSVPDCFLYEFNEHGKPVALLNLPHLVRGERFHRVKDGVIWNCRNNTVIKVACTGQSRVLGTPPGGADCLLTTPWLRQMASLSFGRWAYSDPEYEPIAYNDEFALCVPESGYIATGDRSTYHFPLLAIDLHTGAERSLTLHVPVEIKTPEREQNRHTLPSDRTAIVPCDDAAIAVTRLRFDRANLEITLSRENWSGQLNFDLRQFPDLRTIRSDNREDLDVQAWVKSLGDVNKSDKDGDTPLLDRAGDVDSRYVRALLRAGANPKKSSKNGWTPLMYAACYGTAEMVQLLIDAGSDVNARDNNCGGQTVLMWAAGSSRGPEKKVRALLKAGADPKATLESGSTSLMSAASGGNTATVELLLSAGLDVKSCTNKGETALMRAAGHEESSPELIRVLLKAGADVNAKDKNGKSVLMYCADGFADGRIMQALLDAGASPRTKDASGRTALDFLKGSNHFGASDRREVLEKALKKH